MTAQILNRQAADPRPAVALFLFCFAVFFCGCKKPSPLEPHARQPSSAAASAATSGSGLPTVPQTAAAVDQLEENFSRVHFDFDSARLTESGAALLDENAVILARHPELVVEIQGHADPRGATGYNLALGAQRAQSARARLMIRGIGSDRLPTVTFGEERPLTTGAEEQALARNRRVEFRVVRGITTGVKGTVD